VLDVVLALRQPQDYDPREGARFEVHFEKSRGLRGDVVTPFEARLDVHGSSAVWTMREIEDAQAEEIRDLRGEGRSVRQIAAQLGISKSSVQRALDKLSVTVPLSPSLGSGTAGHQGLQRDKTRDKSGTAPKKGRPNLKVVKPESGTEDGT
jgi:hypothetical protein